MSSFEKALPPLDKAAECSKIAPPVEALLLPDEAAEVKQTYSLLVPHKHHCLYVF